MDAPSSTLPSLDTSPRRAGWFKRSVATLVMLSISVGSFAQVTGPILRGSYGQPVTGFAPNGTFIQNGVVVGNPHQQLHNLENPSLWTLGAAALTNTTDPSFVQGTLGQMEGVSAPLSEPGGLSMGRLYINTSPANPYTAAAPFSNPADQANQANNALIWNQAVAGTGGYQSAGGTWIARTHPDSSGAIFNSGLTGFVDKGVVNAAMDPNGGAVAVWLTQGAAVTRHLAAVQQQNANLLGSRIFFTQQNMGSLSPTQSGFNSQADATIFEQMIGSSPNLWGGGTDPSFQLGYIRDDGSAQFFNLSDKHFRGSQSQGAWSGDSGGLEFGRDDAWINAMLGQELRSAADKREKGLNAAAGIDMGYFQDSKALFMQGIDLYRHVNKGDWGLLDGLRTGAIGPGHPDYARARALSEDAFKQAYVYHTEYDTKPKYTKEAAAYQANQLQLTGVSNADLFGKGLNLFDKRGDPEQERLLGMLQRGELSESHPRYQEIRGLAEARFKVAYQKALEPPPKPNPLKQIVAVVVAAIVVYFTAGAASVWAAGLTGATTTTVAGVTTVVTTTAAGVSAAGVAATAIGSAVGAYAGAVVGAGIQTGSLSKALAAGENSLKGGVAGILVNTAMAMAGVSAGNLGGSLGVSKEVGEAVYGAITNSMSQSIAYGGSFGDALISNAVNAGVDLISANVASEIGARTDPGSFEKYAAHAALGCGVGVAKSGSGDGCAPAAVGAVAGHMAADSIKVALNNANQDPSNANPIALMAAAVPGRTLDDNVVFWGGLTGGAAAALATGGKDVQTDFNLGQGAAANAIKNNYLKYDEAKKLQALKEQELKGQCTGNCKAEITRLEAVDKQRNEQLAQCEGSTSAGCQQAFKDVRLAAADYVRKNDIWLSSGLRVNEERNETMGLARQTMDGYTVWNVVKGGAAGIAESVKGLAEAGYTGFEAILGDAKAQAQVKAGLGGAWDFVSNPTNWPQLMGAMSPAQREQLALAYETGNGAAVAQSFSEVLTNLPTGVGSVKNVANVADKVSDLARIERLAARADVDGVVQVPTGSKGNWDPRINTGTTGNLTPNTAYVLDNGHSYITDATGRVKEVSGDLSLNKMDRNTYQQGCSGASGCAGDDGGHLIASALGGAGDRVNMVPQASTLNRGDWKAMENEFAGYLKEGKNVSVKIEVGYPDGGGVRPNGFSVIATVNGVPLKPRDFQQ